jgi:hypothetical protein
VLLRVIDQAGKTIAQQQLLPVGLCLRPGSEELPGVQLSL